MANTSSFQTINVGAAPNDGTGDDLRDAFIKVNSNFSNITNVGENIGNLLVSGFANIAGNLNISGSINVIGNVNYSNVYSNVTSYSTLAISSTLDSNSTTTGALTVAGGVGIVKNVNVGGNIYAGNVSATNFLGTILTTAQPNITAIGNVTSLSANGTIQTTGIIYANSGIASTSSITGAIVVNGGISASGNLNIGGGIGVSGNLGLNGQFLVSTGTGLAWSNPAVYTSIIFGSSRVIVTADYANISAGSGNVVSVSSGNVLITGNAIISGNITTRNIQTGNVTATNVTGTLLTNTQPNITSIGNITSLSASGTIQTTGIIYANSGISSTGPINAGGQIYANSAIDSSSTTTGALTVIGGIGATGDIHASNIYANFISGTLVGNVTSAGDANIILSDLIVTGNLHGTISTASQPYITTVGNLVSLNVDSTITVNKNNLATAIVNAGIAGTGNIGASGQGFNTIFATATTAQYADLAEKYLADAEYEPGTVVVIGGEKEVTACYLGKRAIGVVSTNPAYMMNSELENGTYIALKGRVPTKVSGVVKKGDRLIAGASGTAILCTTGSTNVFAIALEDKSNIGVGLIETVII